jgi:DNA polymerase delta subunit 3
MAFLPFGRMLYDFHKSQNGKRPGSVHATYLVYGTRKDEHGGSQPKPSQDDNDIDMMSSMPEPEENDDPVPVLTLSLVPEDRLNGTPVLRVVR